VSQLAAPTAPELEPADTVLVTGSHMKVAVKVAQRQHVRSDEVHTTRNVTWTV